MTRTFRILPALFVASLALSQGCTLLYDTDGLVTTCTRPADCPDEMYCDEGACLPTNPDQDAGVTDAGGADAGTMDADAGAMDVDAGTT